MTDFVFCLSPHGCKHRDECRRNIMNWQNEIPAIRIYEAFKHNTWGACPGFEQDTYRSETLHIDEDMEANHTVYIQQRPVTEWRMKE